MNFDFTYVYGIFKRSELVSISGIVYFPETDNKSLTLMKGDDLRKMDAVASRIMKPGKDEILLKKRIF